MTETPELKPAFLLEVEVGAPQTIGAVGGATRRFIPIVGGRLSGRLDGKILPGGGDWQSIGPDGALEIDAHYIVECAAGLVEIRSTGLRHGAPDILARLARGEVLPAKDYYFRTAIRFQTGAASLAWLNRMLAVSVGERLPDLVRLDVYELT